MTIDRRRDGFDDAFTDTFVARKSTDLPFVFFRESESGKEILLLVDMVRLDNRGENGKAILRIQRSIKVITIDTNYFLMKTLVITLQLQNFYTYYLFAGFS